MDKFAVTFSIKGHMPADPRRLDPKYHYIQYRLLSWSVYAEHRNSG